MRLRYIERCNFRKSEWTNFDELTRKKKWKLAAGEVALLISSRGDQLIFVYAVNALEHEDGTIRTVLHSERLRLTSGGTWNPTMLSVYAEKAGVGIDNVKRFEEYYKNLATA